MNEAGLNTHAHLVRMGLSYMLDFSRPVTLAHAEKHGWWSIHHQLNRCHTEIAEASLAIQHGEGIRRVIDEACDSLWTIIVLLEHIRRNYGVSEKEFNALLDQGLLANMAKVAGKAGILEGETA